MPGRLLLIILVVLAGACSGGGGSSNSHDTPGAPGSGGSNPPGTSNPVYSYEMPASSGDGWAVGHLEDHGFDVANVDSFMQEIRGGRWYGIDGIAIVRDHELLLNYTFRTELDQFDGWIGNTSLDLHSMHSTSKSFVSALVGIAIDLGYLPGVSRPYYELFSYPTYDNWDSRKSDMTLEDVLTMRLGLDWDETRYPYTDPRNDLVHLTRRTTDWVKALLDLPLVATPGEAFVYNTAASTSMARALELATGRELEEFAEEVLFGPLGITALGWALTPASFPNTGSGLFLGTRDMAKFGQLYLDHGTWNGVQVISRDWVAASVTGHVSLTDRGYVTGYGYQWWLGKFAVGQRTVPYFSTQGYGGQLIFVVPDLALVVAFTGSNYDNGHFYAAFQLMERYILTDAMGCTIPSGPAAVPQCP